MFWQYFPAYLGDNYLSLLLLMCILLNDNVMNVSIFNPSPVSKLHELMVQVHVDTIFDFSASTVFYLELKHIQLVLWKGTVISAHRPDSMRVKSLTHTHTHTHTQTIMWWWDTKVEHYPNVFLSCYLVLPSVIKEQIKIYDSDNLHTWKEYAVRKYNFLKHLPSDLHCARLVRLLRKLLIQELKYYFGRVIVCYAKDTVMKPPCCYNFCSNWTVLRSTPQVHVLVIW
jgi:hypothetical protein